MSGLTPTPARAHLDRVARGSLLGLVGAVIAAAGGFALVAVVTRGVTADRAGVFFAVTAMFLISEGTASLGTTTGLARFLLRHEAAGRPDAVMATLRVAAVPVLATACLLGTALFVGAGPISAAAGLGELGTVPLRVVALALPCAALAELALAGARAFGEIRSTVLVERIVRTGLQLLLAVVVLAAGGGLTALAAAWATAYVVTAGLAVRALHRTLRRRGVTLRFGAPDAGVTVGREFWRFTWLPGVTRIAQLGMQKLDIILVAALLSPTAAAVYTAATRFVPMGQLAVQAIQQVVQPRFTAILVHDDDATLRRVHQVATTWSIVLAWPVHVGVAALASSYLGIFGDRIAGVDGAMTAVVIMAVAMLVAVATGPVDTLLLMSGRSGLSAANALLALTVDVVLCLLLIPWWGLAGAAVAWASAVLLRCGLAYVQVHRALGVQSFGPQVVRAGALVLGCLGVPLVAAGLWFDDPVSIGLAIGVAATAYALGLRRHRADLDLDHLLRAVTPRAGGTR